MQCTVASLLLFRNLRGKKTSIVIRSTASLLYNLTENGGNPNHEFQRNQIEIKWRYILHFDQVFMSIYVTYCWVSRSATHEIIHVVWYPHVSLPIISCEYPITLFCYDPGPYG